MTSQVRTTVEEEHDDCDCKYKYSYYYCVLLLVSFLNTVFILLILRYYSDSCYYSSTIAVT